jgi:nicotinamide mononucleotide transporter
MRGVSGWLVATVAVAFAWGELMMRFTDAAAPRADAFIVAASLCAQYLLAQKKLESWYWWIAVDVVAIIVYWSRDLRLTSGLYAVFLGLCMMGLTEWRKSRHTAMLTQAQSA